MFSCTILWDFAIDHYGIGLCKLLQSPLCRTVAMPMSHLFIECERVWNAAKVNMQCNTALGTLTWHFLTTLATSSLPVLGHAFNCVVHPIILHHIQHSLVLWNAADTTLATSWVWENVSEYTCWQRVVWIPASPAFLFLWKPVCGASMHCWLTRWSVDTIISWGG